MSKPEAPCAWRTMAASDLNAVVAAAQEVHPAHPEAMEVFAERLRLWPDGCYGADARFMVRALTP